MFPLSAANKQGDTGPRKGMFSKLFERFHRHTPPVDVPTQSIAEWTNRVPSNVSC